MEVVTLNAKRISQKISNLNYKRVINYLLTSELPISRARISKDLHISFPSVSDIVSKLIKEGLVVEEGKGQAHIGRKPILLRINNRYGLCGVVQIGYETVRINILDTAGDLILEEEFPFSRSLNFPSLLEEIIVRVEKITAPMLAKEFYNFLGIAFSVPAPIDHRQNRIIWSRFYHWESEALPQQINIRNKRVNAFWENDSNLLAYGASQMFGNVSDLLAFYLGIGIGAGIVLGGNLHQGLDGMAGEIGQVLVPFKGELLELERVISEESLVGLAKKCFPNKSLESNEHLLELLERETKKKSVRKELEKIAETVAQFLAVITIALDPEMVVFDGEIVRRAPTLLGMIVDNLVKFSRKRKEIFKTADGRTNFAVCGAYRLILKHWFGLGEVETFR